MFLYFTIPGLKEELRGDSATPVVTEALPASEAANTATHEEKENSSQYDIEQEEQEQLDFNPQELEPQIAR